MLPQATWGEVVALVVAFGSGSGIAEMIRSIARSIVTVCERHPHAKVLFNEEGRVREVHGLSVEEIGTLLEAAQAARTDPTAHIVRAFEATARHTLDELFDPATGDYFAPGSGRKPIVLGDPNKSGSGPRQLTAFLDTGVMMHHPWIRGRVQKRWNVISQNNRVEDGNGHGTLVALTFLQTVGQLVGSLDGVSIMVVRVLDDNGIGTEDDLKAGLRWAADNGATTINLSLSLYRPSGCAADCGLCDMVESLDRTGIGFFLAAGNEPHRVSCPQARGPRTFKVGTVSGSVLTDYSGPGAGLLFQETPGLRRVASDGQWLDAATDR